MYEPIAHITVFISRCRSRCPASTRTGASCQPSRMPDCQYCQRHRILVVRGYHSLITECYHHRIVYRPLKFCLQRQSAGVVPDGRAAAEGDVRSSGRPRHGPGARGAVRERQRHGVPAPRRQGRGARARLRSRGRVRAPPLRRGVRGAQPAAARGATPPPASPTRPLWSGFSRCGPTCTHLCTRSCAAPTAAGSPGTPCKRHASCCVSEGCTGSLPLSSAHC